jgi:hypothetical protein
MYDASHATPEGDHMRAQFTSVHYLRLFIFLLIVSGPLPAHAQQWAQLPPTPELPRPDHSGTVAANGIRIWYAVFGDGEPVILVHGAFGNSNYWGLQVPVLAQHYKVIVLDSRGQGPHHLE